MRAAKTFCWVLAIVVLFEFIGSTNAGNTNWRIDYEVYLQSKASQPLLPAVTNFMEGYQRSIEADRLYCEGIQKLVSGELMDPEEFQRRSALALSKRKVSPRFYLLKLKAMLVGKTAAERRDAASAIGLLAQEVKCAKEWEYFQKITIITQLRSLAKSDRDKTVSAAAGVAVEHWEEAENRWSLGSTTT